MHTKSALSLPNLTPDDLPCDTVQAAKRILGPAGKKTTLERWRVRGVGPRWYKVAGLVRYRPADIDAYIALCMRQSTSDPGPSDPESGR